MEYADRYQPHICKQEMFYFKNEQLISKQMNINMLTRMEKYKILFKKKQMKQFICAEIKDCDIFKSRNTVVIEKNPS